MKIICGRSNFSILTCSLHGPDHSTRRQQLPPTGAASRLTRHSSSSKNIPVRPSGSFGVLSVRCRSAPCLEPTIRSVRSPRPADVLTACIRNAPCLFHHRHLKLFDLHPRAQRVLLAKLSCTLAAREGSKDLTATRPTEMRPYADVACMRKRPLGCVPSKALASPDPFRETSSKKPRYSAAANNHGNSSALTPVEGLRTPRFRRTLEQQSTSCPDVEHCCILRNID
jgi:hypothetical protein